MMSGLPHPEGVYDLLEHLENSITYPGELDRLEHALKGGDPAETPQVEYPEGYEDWLHYCEKHKLVEHVPWGDGVLLQISADGRLALRLRNEHKAACSKPPSDAAALNDYAALLVSPKVRSIVEDRTLTADEKLRRLASDDPRVYALKSPILGPLLGVTPDAIRQTSWWKQDRMKHSKKSDD